MIIHHKFTGIDIGKFNFVVANHGGKNTKEYINDSLGIDSFLKIIQKLTHCIFWKLQVDIKWNMELITHLFKIIYLNQCITKRL